MFEKLMWVNITFYVIRIFFFLLHHSTLYVFFNGLRGFSLFFFYQIILISWSMSRAWWINSVWLDSYYSGYRFVMLTRVDLDWFVFVNFLLNFVLFVVNRIRIELYHFFHSYHDHFFIWFICYCYFFFYHLVKIKPTYLMQLKQ
jgi:hypothetical protein